MTGFSVNLIDRHVGSRVRARRIARGMTIANLALALGVEAPEAEMLEEGALRLDAARLLQACRALDCDVSYFFAGFGADQGRRVPHLRLADSD